jgi:catechol 2,3-dioxygenase-like lactoylglutathione lyase family enzyme
MRFALLGVSTCLILGCGLVQPADTPAADGGSIVGFAYDALHVSDLHKSIEFYRALGFQLTGDSNPQWTSDKAAQRLYKADGARFRTAILTMANASSGKPFVLQLREFKGIKRKTRSDLEPRDPGATHMGVLAPDADALWAQLKRAGLLRALSWGGKLIRRPGETSGGLAYIMDADGMNIEIIGRRAASAAADQAGNASTPALHHVGLAVLSADRAKAFYGSLLGASFPAAPPQWMSGDFVDSVVGGRGYVLRFFNGDFPDASAREARVRMELVEYQKPHNKDLSAYRYYDIGVNSFGFEVEDIDAVHTRLTAAGARTWSEGGIVALADGRRAVVVRDPDVGAFVELFEKP